MLNIRANNQHLAVALNPKSIRSTRVVVPLTGDFGLYIVDAGGEVLAGIFDLQKIKIGPPFGPTAQESTAIAGAPQRFLADYRRFGSGRA